MKTFKYPVFFKYLYRYGNFPVTLLLMLYLIPSVLNIDNNLIFIIPTVLFLFLIYYMNKRYLHLYKIIPYNISADEVKLFCSEFLFSKKEVIIFYNDIISLQGGIFDGRLSGLMKVYDGRNKVHIGFYSKLRNANELQTIILSRVNKPVYDEVVNRISSRRTPSKKK